MLLQFRFRWSRIMLLLLTVALLSQQGCVHRKKYSLSSMWMDYNTLRAPAIFIEKREHFPYKAHQVALFHWQYGVTPGRNVKYVRPDLVGNNMTANSSSPYDGVMNVSAEGQSYNAEMQPIPIGAANSSMSVDAPQGTMLPQKPHPTTGPIKKNARFSIEMIPPPPAPPVP
ncbi:MAG: hypothetical protein KDA70_19610 [Planctomycetaceae bacterium]|nr:hypothetical protein [Planctomycetaceae bacterium]